MNQRHLESHQRRRPGSSDGQLSACGQMQLAAKEAFDISQESAATLEMYGVPNEKTRDYATRWQSHGDWWNAVSGSSRYSVTVKYGTITVIF
ncbi:MAG: hypothetical protein R3C28_16325 [Pirellulaceae bacterium]